jgi:HK97 family phage portal protein
MNPFQWLGRIWDLGARSRRFWASLATGDNPSGEPSTPDTAISLAAFGRGVRLRAQTLATLPKDIYKYDTKGVAHLVTDPADQYRQVIKISPNADQTPVEFWEGFFACMDLTGDGLARKRKIGNRLVALEMLNPLRVTTRRENGRVTHEYLDTDGKRITLSADEVFQLKGFSLGGDRGLSVVTYGARTIGAALAADKVAAKMFKAGLSSSGFLETNSTLEEPDRVRLNQILSEYQGNENAGKIMILEGGMKYTAVSLSAADAQLLQARGFNIEEIARLLDMPPVLLGHNGSGATMWGTGVGEIIRAWYMLGLQPLIIRIEAAINKRLIAPEDQGRYFVKLNAEGLLRGDSASRAAFYSVMVQNGLMTRAEVRELEDLEVIDGADMLTAQSNLLPLDKLGEDQGSGAGGGEIFKQQIRQWLGLEVGATAQDLHEIRNAIAEIRARQAQPIMLEQPPAPAIPSPSPAPPRDRSAA